MDVEILPPGLETEHAAFPHVERLQALFRGTMLPFPRGCFFNLTALQIAFVTDWLATRNSGRVLDCGSLYSFRPFVEHRFADEYHTVDNGQALCDRGYHGLPDPLEWEQFVDHHSKGSIRSKFAHLEALPYPDAYFDVVICVHTLEFTFDDAAAMAEIRRVLRPGGTLLLVTRLNFHNPIGYVPHFRSRFYSPDQIMALLGTPPVRAFADAGPERCTAENPWPQYVNVFIEWRRPDIP